MGVSDRSALSISVLRVRRFVPLWWRSALLMGLLLAACSRPGLVQVRVEYAGAAGAPALQELAAIVGSSKSIWPELAPGEAVSVVLNPESGSPDLTIVFQRAGKGRSWEGPRLGGVGYVIVVRIGSDGSIRERHCRSPCSLSE